MVAKSQQFETNIQIMLCIIATNVKMDGFLPVLPHVKEIFTKGIASQCEYLKHTYRKRMEIDYHVKFGSSD